MIKDRIDEVIRLIKMSQALKSAAGALEGFDELAEFKAGLENGARECAERSNSILAAEGLADVKPEEEVNLEELGIDMDAIEAKADLIAKEKVQIFCGYDNVPEVEEGFYNKFKKQAIDKLVEEAKKSI